MGGGGGGGGDWVGRGGGGLLVALGDPALGDHVELLGPLVDGVVAGVVELGVGPDLLQVPHAGGEVCVEAVVQPRLDRGQVHRLGHHLQQVRLHLTGTIRPQEDHSSKDRNIDSERCIVSGSGELRFCNSDGCW